MAVAARGMSAAHLRAFSHPSRSLALGLLAASALVLVCSTPAAAMESQIVGDVKVPGNEVRGEVYTVIGDVTIEGGVQGDVRCAFGDVVVRGPVGGNVKTGFGDVYVDAPVGGSVDVGYGDVGLGPQAYIAENLSQGNGESSRHPASVIQGDVRSGMMSSGSPLINGGVALANLTVWLLTTLGFCALAMLGAIVARRPLGACARSLERSPGRSMLWGLASLPTAALFSVVLAITIIGAPLLLLSVPAYLALVVFGALVSAYFIGSRILVLSGHHRGGEALASAVGAFAVSVVYLVPFIGGVALFLMALLGAGATIAAVLERLLAGGAYERGGEEAEAAEPSYESYVGKRRG